MEHTLTAFGGMEVDNEVQPISDQDSAIGISAPNSTASVRSSLYNYVEENGRTYHAFNPGKYIGPNDVSEQERLDLQHSLFLLTMDNKLHLAPIPENPQNVLDICTGTGIWAIEFARQYPSAVVLGTDLSPIQPTHIPSNCSFVIDDAEEEWVYSQHFDYIHARAIISCFRDPQLVAAKVYENLAPGGYFELQDPVMPFKSIDNSLDGTALGEWQTMCMAAAEKLGRPWTNTKNWSKWMKEQGFVDVVEQQYFWAINPWVRGQKQKLQATILQQNLTEGLAAWGLSTLSRGFGWSKEKIDELLEKAKIDLKNRNIHAYVEVYVVYGRKPQ